MLTLMLMLRLMPMLMLLVGSGLLPRLMLLKLLHMESGAGPQDAAYCGFVDLSAPVQPAFGSVHLPETCLCDVGSVPLWGGRRHLGEGAKIAVFSQDLAQVCCLSSSPIYAFDKTTFCLQPDEISCFCVVRVH